MLARLLLSTALILPASAYAVCSMSQSDRSTVTVTYGGKGCSRSEATKAAFAKDLKQAVVAMDAATDARARAELRTSTQQKLYDIADLRHQSRHLSGPRYYGQK